VGSPSVVYPDTIQFAQTIGDAALMRGQHNQLSVSGASQTKVLPGKSIRRGFLRSPGLLRQPDDLTAAFVHRKETMCKRGYGCSRPDFGRNDTSTVPAGDACPETSLQVPTTWMRCAERRAP
jgi:hypothetical protein